MISAFFLLRTNGRKTFSIEFKMTFLSQQCCLEEQKIQEPQNVKIIENALYFINFPNPPKRTNTNFGIKNTKCRTKLD